ncbi:MAG: efflux transporter, family, subunit [Verrucomicrobiales bacterium]|nr:efflux transporter, family, subunit [Verrucomicrobiales bacterium]
MTSPDRGALDGLKLDRTASAPRRSFPWGLIIFLLLIPVAAVAAWMFWPRGPEYKTMLVRSTSAAAPATAAGATLLNASGYVTARRAATVSAKVTGKVTEVLVEEGMKVADGQIVARIDNSNALAGLHLSEARLEAARRTLEETKPTLTFAELELQRFVKLRASNAASQSDIARAESEVAALKARQIRQEADITVAERSVDEWKQQVDDTIIRTSFAGVVTTKDAQPGEIISPMSSGGFTRTGICTVVDMTSLEIEVDVSESYLNRIQPNQPAEATLDAYGDWRIPCKVTAIIPTADRQKATVKVRVAFLALDPRILPEMGVKVAFQSAAPPPGTQPDATPAKSVIAIPESALTEVNGRRVVWVFHDGKAERRAVTVSRTTGGEAVLAAGLNAGEKIITNPTPALTDGAAVREAKP